MAGKLFGKVLIAIDGSENNRRVIEEGVRLVRECGVAGYAVYVVDTTTFSSSSGEIPLGDTYSIFMDEAEKAFERVKSLGKGLNIETAILEGKPASEIVNFATEKDIDLIVIGSKGKTGIERLLLGSVADGVVRSSPCKVLVVK